MIITIRLSAGLRAVAGAKTVTVHTGPHATVRDLLRGLRDANPALAIHLLTAEGDLAAGMLMVVRGQHIDFQQGLDTPVDPADDVMIIPPLAGG